MSLRPVLLTALLLCAAPAAAQQSLELAVTGGEPIEVEASEALEWRQEEKLFIARGDAVFRQGELQVNAATLTANYRETEAGETDIYRMTAEGGVVITRGTDRITGGHAVYDVDTEVFTMTGGPLRLESGEDVITAERSLEFRQAQQVAIATGNATATRGTDHLEAEVLTGHFAPGPTGDLALSSVEADGGVRITTATDVVTGDSATYDIKGELATLTGSVKLTRGQNQLNGDYAEVNLATGVSRLLTRPGSGERVRGLLVPEEGEQQQVPELPQQQ
jgi:lipopolysaccharide export system protein LptA